MRVTNKMIAKQLRIRGLIFKLFMQPKNETQYLKAVKRNNSMFFRFFKGKNIKGVNCSECKISRQKEASKIRIRIYKPLVQTGMVPGILWIHGGGYAIGMPETSSKFYKSMMSASNCVVIALDYRLSMEAPYPAALEDCYEVLLWMKEHAKELNIRDDQLMIGGESAGGGLTAALSLYARDKGGVNIAFQMPIYPMIDDRMITESALDNNAPVWDSKSNEYAWKLYLRSLDGKDVPIYAAPSRATDYSHLPPTLTFVGSIEPFRDETIEYVNQLRQAGVPVAFEVYPGCYHGFDIVSKRTLVSKKATAFFIDGFKFAVTNYFAEQLNPHQEFIQIIQKFADSGWNLIDTPAKQWLMDRSPAHGEALFQAVTQANIECGTCGCEFDPLYKKVLKEKDFLLK